jgi:beta-phosphoglucomutase-like phosphatase (HAD superfamily)
VKIALVSDIHFDLRADLANHGVADLFDAYVLSFEHGFQKPDPKMFQLALDAVGVEASDALMVGDRVSHDGGAVSVGITTLILPVLRELVPRGLDVVLPLVGHACPGSGIGKSLGRRHREGVETAHTELHFPMELRVQLALTGACLLRRPARSVGAERAWGLSTRPRPSSHPRAGSRTR